jgi:hypothetical protein
MKLTIIERLGNFVSGGAVVKYKLEAMQWETTSRHWKKSAMAQSEIAERWHEGLKGATETLRTIASMGTPNMAHIGKKMRDEALKGLSPKNTG